MNAPLFVREPPSVRPLVISVPFTLRLPVFVQPPEPPPRPVGIVKLELIHNPPALLIVPVNPLNVSDVT